MTRLLGAALVVAGCGALGLAGVGRLESRTRDLGELAAGLDALQRELDWRLAPLPQALEEAAKAARGPAAQFFTRCAQGVERAEGQGFGQLWREALLACPLGLTEEDRRVLERLGPVLGRYDSGSQRQALEEAAVELRRLQGEASEDRRRLGRVYGVLGVTAGLFVAILLL